MHPTPATRTKGGRTGDHVQMGYGGTIEGTTCRVSRVPFVGDRHVPVSCAIAAEGWVRGGCDRRIYRFQEARFKNFSLFMSTKIFNTTESHSGTRFKVSKFLEPGATREHTDCLQGPSGCDLICSRLRQLQQFIESVIGGRT
jgi:hypothetical protein